MLLHVLILRTSSGSMYCSLLKVCVKKLITLLYLLVMRQHIVCLCMRCFQCRGYVDGIHIQHNNVIEFRK